MASKIIGGLSVNRRVDPLYWSDSDVVADAIRVRLSLALREVVQSSVTLSLDSPADRGTLMARLKYSLGLD